MGNGYMYKCESCGKEYDVITGIGFLFPQEYKKILKNISEGKYGRDMRNCYVHTPYMAVDADKNYYECGNCGHWEVAPCLDLYEPKNIANLLKTKYGDKTVEELGEVPYVMPHELKTKYRLIRRYDHQCPKCKAIMEKKNRVRNVSCPSCGKKNRPIEDLLWDQRKRNERRGIGD